MRPMLRGIAVLGTAIALAACSGGGATTNPTAAAGAGRGGHRRRRRRSALCRLDRHHDGLGDRRRLTPGAPDLNAKVGDVITWTNGDSASRTGSPWTTARARCPARHLAAAAARPASSFTKAGTYPFHCIVHPTMKGTIDDLVARSRRPGLQPICGRPCSRGRWSTDAALAASLAGDLEAAFPTLVADHQDRLYTIALRLLGDRRDAEEVAQDALVRAFRAMRGYPADRVAALRLRPWLASIAVNLARNRRRRIEDRQPPTSLEPMVDAGFDPAERRPAVPGTGCGSARDAARAGHGAPGAVAGGPRRRWCSGTSTD